jgi:hypothetical protein
MQFSFVEYIFAGSRLRLIVTIVKNRHINQPDEGNGGDMCMSNDIYGMAINGY